MPKHLRPSRPIKGEDYSFNLEKLNVEVKVFNSHWMVGVSTIVVPSLHNGFAITVIPQEFQSNLLTCNKISRAWKLSYGKQLHCLSGDAHHMPLLLECGRQHLANGHIF